MNLDDVNDQFRSMAMRSIAEDMDAVIEQVIHLEAMSRHEVACTGNAEAANVAAGQAYSIFMDVPMKLTPTLIMGLADKVNREKEALLAALDALDGAAVALEGAVTHFEGGRTNIGMAVVLKVLDDVKLALEEAPYSKTGDGDE